MQFFRADKKQEEKGQEGFGRPGLSYRLGAEFELARVRQLYALLPQSVFGALLIVAALTVYYLREVEWWRMAAWSGGMLAILGIRYAMKSAFDRVRAEVQAITWERYAVWLAACTGLGLSAFTLLLADVQPFERHYFYYMLLAASLIAASVTLAPSGAAFTAYVSAIVPFSLPVLLLMRSGWSIEIGLLVIGFLGYLVLGFLRVHQALMENLEVRMEAQALAEQETRLLDAAQSGIVFVMRDRIVRCNRGFGSMVGEDPERLRRSALAAVIRDRGECEALVELLQRAEHDGPTRTINIRLRAETASPLWCAVTASPIRARHADAGSVLIFTNISEDRRAQEGYELALAAAGVGVWDCDLATGATRHSRELLRLVGDEEGQTQGQPFAMLVHPEDRARALAAERAHLESGSDFDERLRILRRDGRSFVARARALSVRDATGRATRWVGALTPLP